MTTSSISLIIPLVDAQHSRKSGSKAVGLSKLISAHFFVPRGFVISADAYRSHLWASGARNAASATADSDGSENVRTAILTSDIPEDIWSVIAQAYERFSWQIGVADPHVAVRSSALEDSPQGVYEYCLNVSGPEALKTAIKRIWASAWTDKAAEARLRLQNPGEPAMAIIVQQMLDRGCVGTAFTTDPTTGDPSRMLLQCGPISTDLRSSEKSARLIIGLRDFSIIEREEPDKPALSDDTVKLIAERSIIVEDVVGGPAEIEWGYDGERLWILQARTMADLAHYFPVPDDAEPSRLVTGTPICHFSRSYLWESSDKLVDSRLINGYVYARADDAAAKPMAKTLRKEAALGLQMLSDWDSKSAPEIRSQATDIIRNDPQNMDFPTLRSTLATAVGISKRAIIGLEKARHPALRFCELLCEQVPQEAGWLSLYSRLLGGLDDPIVLRDAKLQELGERLYIAEHSGKVGQENWRRSYMRDVNNFVRAYGCSFQDAGEAFDISKEPSWVENNEPVFRTIEALSHRDKRPTLITLHGAAEQDAEAAAAEAETLIPNSKRPLFRDLFKLARSWAAKKSEAIMLCALANTALRLVMVEIGRRLRESGAIAEIDDIFQFTLDDILALPLEPAIVDRNAIASRLVRRKHDLWLECRYAAPKMLAADDEESCSSIYDGVLRGYGVSGGLAAGHARTVTCTEEAEESENGDILIVHSLMQAWTPYLALAGGMVCETGSNSDPQIILARSYGIPIIINCKDALSAIRNGQKITVSGSEGTIEPGDRLTRPRHAAAEEANINS